MKTAKDRPGAYRPRLLYRLDGWIGNALLQPLMRASSTE
jgi:hypothetical protein